MQRPTNSLKLLSKIRQQEKRALAALQEELQRKREAAVSIIVRPLQRRKEKFLRTIAALEKRIDLIDGQISSLLGTASQARRRKAATTPTKQQKKRSHWVAAKKLAMGQTIYDTLAKNKKGLPRKALLDLSKPMEPRVLIAYWNKRKPDSKIAVRGEKSRAVYVV